MKPGIYLVADADYLKERSVIDVVLAAIRGGVTVVQLRAKHLEGRAYMALAQTLHTDMAGLNVPLLLNDRADVAYAVGVEGVHIGQKDLPTQKVRELLGPQAIIGLSVETIAQVEQANNLPVNYIAASPVYATPTKMDTAPAWGIDGLQHVCRLSRHPVCAIGGLHIQNVKAVRKAGASWAAVVSAICRANDVERATCDLTRRFGWQPLA